MRTGADLVRNINDHTEEWFAIHGPAGYFDDAVRLRQLQQLQGFFTSREALRRSSFDALTDALLACAAFHDRLRFARGGLQTLVTTFKRENRFEDVAETFEYLAFGGGDYIQRIYDCVYATDYKLKDFGENCTFELFGWINRDGIPPVNGRVLKALRYLGFNIAP